MRGHRLQTREQDWRLTPQGFPIESAARAWRQTGTIWTLDDLIAAADFLVFPKRRLATIHVLEAEIELMGDVPDGRLARALREVRIGAESTGETRVRLLLTRAGLPELVLQYRLLDARGRFVARLDAAYPEYGLAIEYDGRYHADPEQFAKTQTGGRRSAGQDGGTSACSTIMCAVHDPPPSGWCARRCASADGAAD